MVRESKKHAIANGGQMLNCRLLRAYSIGMGLLFVTLAGAVRAAELSISTDFPGGSAEVQSLDRELGKLTIAPAVREERGWPCWWYFRVDGAQRGQTLTLQVQANQKPYRFEEVLTGNWALPQRAAISVDNEHWQHTEAGRITKAGGTYTIVAPAEQFWLAWGPPFLPAHAEALLAQVARQLPAAERFTLATTRGGQAVNAIRLGKRGAAAAVWVHARQHAWEAGSSWVGKGLLEWLASEDAAAVAWRQETELFFVPIMDVDNVSMGAGGKGAVPRDHNRDWSDSPVYPEVAAAQRSVRGLVDAGRLRVFVDLHNPAPGDKQPFFYGPLDYEQMTGPRRLTYDRFLALARESITGPLKLFPEYRFATYVKTEEERRRVSANWVRDISDAHTAAVCLETSWNTPASTTEGYQRVGRELAQAIVQFGAVADRR